MAIGDPTYGGGGNYGTPGGATQSYGRVNVPKANTWEERRAEAQRNLGPNAYQRWLRDNPQGRVAGAGAAQPPAAATPQSVLAALRRGDISPAEALDQLMKLGWSNDDATQQVEANMPPGGAAGGALPASGGGAGATPPTYVDKIPNRGNRQPLFGEDAEAERRELPLDVLFQQAVRSQVPQGGASPWEGYLQRQAAPLSQLYRLGQAFEDIPDERNLYDWVRSRPNGISRPGTGDFANYARRGADALSNPGDESGAAYGYFAGLNEDGSINSDTGLKRQFDVAVSGSRPNLAREFRPAFEGAARRQFNQFRYDRPGEDFLPYLQNRNWRFF